MTLTVAELIARLAELDPDLPVVMRRPTELYPEIVTPCSMVSVLPARDFAGRYGIRIVLECALGRIADGTPIRVVVLG